jgi:hypothetical protein
MRETEIEGAEEKRKKGAALVCKGKQLRKATEGSGAGSVNFWAF